MEIVRDQRDRDRFLDLLYFLNEDFKSDFWEREVLDLPRFTRPDHWPERRQLTDILCWTLLPNHLHLLLQVRDDNEKGVPLLMQKLFRSMTGHFNEKYTEIGSIFQGPYKSKTIDSDSYLRYVIPYVMVKNTFELHPMGFEYAASHFEEAWKWARTYPYSSLANYLGETVSPILSPENIVHQMFRTENELKSVSHDMLIAHHQRHAGFRELQLED